MCRRITAGRKRGQTRTVRVLFSSDGAADHEFAPRADMSGRNWRTPGATLTRRHDETHNHATNSVLVGIRGPVGRLRDPVGDQLGGCERARSNERHSNVLISEKLLGLFRGETIRVCIGQKIDASGRVSAIANGRIEIYSEREGIIKSYDLAVPPKQFRCLDIPDSDLNIEADSEPRRLQIRLRILVSACAASKPLDFIGSIETSANPNLIDAFFEFGCAGRDCPPPPPPPPPNT